VRGRIGAIILVLILPAALPWPARAWAAELVRGRQHLTITGSDTVAYSQESVSGGELAARASRYDTPDETLGLAHRSQLYVRGDLLPDVRIAAHLSHGGYGPSQSAFTLTYDGSDAQVAIGDLSVALAGNTFIPFTRSLLGMKVDAQLDRGALTLLVSRSKAPTKTDVFYGRNTSGPYYLAASPIVDGSDQVRVDGVTMQRGRDYTMDYQAGILFFDSSRIIPPTSKVEVAYENLSPIGLSGSLLAARATLPVSNRLDLGATYFTVKRPETAGSSTSPRRDEWTGNNTPGPFPLSYRPVVKGSERVRVEGILQVRDMDYHLDTTSGLLYFLRPVPMGALILVDYQVSAVQEASGGDQSVAGFDLRYRPDGHVGLVGQFAASHGGASPADSGAAVGLQMAGKWAGLSLTGNWQAMSPTFAAVDSVGARGPRSGGDLNLSYQPRPWAALNASLSLYRHAYDDVFGATDGNLQVSDRERSLSLEISPPHWPTLSLRTTRHALTGDMRDDSGSDSLRVAYTHAAFGLTGEIERTSTNSLLPSVAWNHLGGGGYGANLGYGAPDRRADSPGDRVPYQATTLLRRLALSYRPSDRLNITCDLAGNAIQTPGSQGDTRAHSQHLGMSYSPWRAVTLDFDFASYGAGQSRSPDGWETPASNNLTRSVSLRYTPSGRVALSLTQDTQRAVGGYSGNSDSNGTTLAAYLVPCEGISLNATYGLHRLRYLGATGASNNHIAGLALKAGPWQRLTLELGYQQMDGLSSGAFSSPLGDEGNPLPAAGPERLLSGSLTGRLSYAMGARHTAFLETESSRTLGYPSRSQRTATAVGWEYTLSRLVKARLDWRRTVQMDLGDPRYNYTSNRLNAEIKMDF
jgi:hypothetical protein